MNNNAINESPAAPSINVTPAENQEIDNKMSNIEWTYNDKNNDFLLRFCYIDKKNIIIRIEILMTNTISDKNEMYAYSFKGKEIIEDLEYEKNLDAFTTLTVLFENNTPLGEINKKNAEEFQLIITRNTKKYKFTLKKQICNDNKFFNMNIDKKIKQIKQKIDDKYNEFIKENEELKKRNESLKKELEAIKAINEELSKENETISTNLIKLEEKQTKAITQLKDLQEDDNDEQNE